MIQAGVARGSHWHPPTWPLNARSSGATRSCLYVGSLSSELKFGPSHHASGQEQQFPRPATRWRTFSLVLTRREGVGGGWKGAGGRGRSSSMLWGAHPPWVLSLHSKSVQVVLYRLGGDGHNTNRFNELMTALRGMLWTYFYQFPRRPQRVPLKLKAL